MSDFDVIILLKKMSKNTWYLAYRKKYKDARKGLQLELCSTILAVALASALNFQDILPSSYDPITTY